MFNSLYNWIISDVTKLCYQDCLELFAPDSRILDVGIGNGVMLESYHSMIQEKNLQITGLDINLDYIKHCRKLIERYSLQDQLQVLHKSVFNYSPGPEEKYDYVLFSMSFMLLPDQEKALDQAKSWLKPEGNLVFFQTMFHSRSPMLEFIKPKLKYLTSIDFGQVTYEDEFFQLLQQKGLATSEDRLLKRKWFSGEYRVIVTQPEHRRQRTYSPQPSAEDPAAELWPASQS
ncbi:MAG: class I SAM-dependent methyltransferase [Desulfohalobiaceae bacterium]